MSARYEWMLLPAVGTFLFGTFTSRAAVQRGLQVAPLALLTMSFSLVLTILLALCLAPRALFQQWQADSTVVALVGGAAGGIGLCFSFTALRQRATGPVTTISAMSIVVPIALGLIAGWDAAPGLTKGIGAALTLAGTVTINIGKSPRPEGERFHWIGLALGALLCFGISQASQKYITVIHPQQGHDARYGFMASYYIAASVTLAIYVLTRSQKVSARHLPYAFCLGINSLVQFVSMLMLLQHVSTAVVYITFTGGGIILVLLVSSLVLEERYKPAVWLGCILGAAGIVLM